MSQGSSGSQIGYEHEEAHKEESDEDKQRDDSEQVLFDFSRVTATLSLLAQFSSTKVRADFVNGEFGPQVNPHILKSLDELKCLVLPWWNGNNLLVPNERQRNAAQHLIKLIRQTNETLSLSTDSGQSLTYYEWHKLLEVIASSKYWQKTKPEERCVHTIEEMSIKKESMSRQESWTSSEAESYQSANNNMKKVKRGAGAAAAARNRKVEEIVVITSEDEDSSTEINSSSSTSGDDKRKKRQRKNRRSKWKNRKEVVTPPVFRLDGKTSLQTFFKNFDEYFERKYSGTEYDKCQLLEDFLEGKLLEIYQIKGGRKIKYVEMRLHLQQWFKKQKLGGRSFWRSQLETSRPGEDEALDIYAMRLIELIDLAYPYEKAEGARQLRRQFLETIDVSIAEKVIDSERIMLNVQGKKGHVPFSTVVELAVNVQRDSSRQPQRGHTTICWTRPRNEDNFRDSVNRTDDSVRPKSNYQEVTRTAIKPRTFSGKRTDKECHYCKKVGHLRKDCWRASKSCLLCGLKHKMEDCPKYDPNYRTRNSKDLNA